MNIRAKTETVNTFVKLANGAKFPKKLRFTSKALNLFNRGLEGQGYIYFIDLDIKEHEIESKGNVHLIPAVNAPNQKTLKDGSLIDKTSIYKNKQAIIAKLQPKVKPPKTIDGSCFKSDEYLISKKAKTSETGGTGGGDLHKMGARRLGLANKNLIAGGFWKDQNDFQEFRTRSTQNTFTFERSKLFKIYIHDKFEAGDEIGHTMVYNREIPLPYLKPIIKAFYKELYPKKLLSICFSEHLRKYGPIPKSTDYHMEAENDWENYIFNEFWLNRELNRNNIIKINLIINALKEKRFFIENLKYIFTVINYFYKHRKMFHLCNLIDNPQFFKKIVNNSDEDNINLIIKCINKNLFGKNNLTFKQIILNKLTKEKDILNIHKFLQDEPQKFKAIAYKILAQAVDENDTNTIHKFISLNDHLNLQDIIIKASVLNKDKDVLLKWLSNTYIRSYNNVKLNELYLAISKYPNISAADKRQRLGALRNAAFNNLTNHLKEYQSNRMKVKTLIKYKTQPIFAEHKDKTGIYGFFNQARNTNTVNKIQKKISQINHDFLYYLYWPFRRISNTFCLSNNNLPPQYK